MNRLIKHTLFQAWLAWAILPLSVLGQATINLNDHAPTTAAPVAGATLNWYTDAAATTLVANAASAPAGLYYAAYTFTGLNGCVGKSIAAPLRYVTKACGSSSVNLADYVETTGMPTGYTLSYHSGVPASASNELPSSTVNPSSLTTYYVAYKSSFCYHAASPIVVGFASCTITLSGTVFSDGNGNGLIDTGEMGSNLGSSSLTVYLVNAADLVVDKASVNPSTGAYTLSGALNTAYKVVLSNASAANPGDNAPAASLPNGGTMPYLNTRENYGTNNAAGSGVEAPNTLPGVIAVNPSGNVTTLTFGINSKPLVQNATADSSPNPGGTLQAALASSLFTGQDREDAPLGYASNLTGRTVILYSATGGTLYYNGNAITSTNQTLSNGSLRVSSVNDVSAIAGTTSIPNFDPSKLSVDPTDPGATQTTFDYAVIDNAGVASDPKTVTVPFTDASLPVTLVSFNAKAVNTVAQLTWASSVETNTDRFEIQTSTDAERWLTLGQVKAAGGSTSMKYYAFTHAQPAPGINYYRLKMIDLDQTFAFSRTLSVEFDKLMAKSLVYPNPATDRLQLGGVEPSRVSKVELINGQGRVLYSAPEWSPEGLKVTAYPSGVYLLKLSLSDGSAHTHKVLIAR